MVMHGEEKGVIEIEKLEGMNVMEEKRKVLEVRREF